MAEQKKTSFSVQEVASLLDVSKNTVYDLIHRNELAAYRIGRKVRVDLQDIENYKNKTRNIQKPATPPPAEQSPPSTPPDSMLVGAYQVPPLAQQTTQSMQSTVQTAVSAVQSLLPSGGVYPPAGSVNGMRGSLIICGQDLLLDILARHMECQPYNVAALRSYKGSYDALVELYKGNVSIASVRMWDAETGEYNLPYIVKMLPGFSCTVVNLAFRTVGFYVPAGNPKKLHGWEDLSRGDITFVNRDIGCGSRVLIDQHLQRLGVSKYNLPGYGNVVYSHIAAASAVANGDADVAIGNEKSVQQVRGLDFIPLQNERLDLVVPMDFVYGQYLQVILNVLRSDAFKNELMGIGGYDMSQTGSIIAEIK